MAHVVPKREPCVKCGNPIFLAERLVIKQSLYHRTCLRCARCQSLLTIGNFYETENDHEFCCETCPDEEKSSGPKVDVSNRLSVAQKIAIFEKETTSVLRKSLSDEEKSKSLSRQPQIASPSASSAALNSFLATQITSKTDAVNGDSRTFDSSSDSDSDIDDVPPIPENHPSDIELNSERLLITDHINEAQNSTSLVTKEHNHINDTEAIADITYPESHDEKYISKVPDIVATLQQDEIDEFELLFEQIAEDAVKSPIVVIPVAVKRDQSPIKIIPPPEKYEIIDVPIIVQRDPTPEPIDVKNSIEDSLESVPEAEEKPADVSFQKVPEIPENIEVQSEEIPENIEVQLENADAPEIEENKIEPTNVDELKLDNTVYPDDLNPFDEAEEAQKENSSATTSRPSLNPFGSEDEDEEQLNKSTGSLSKPPRPPLPKVMTLRKSTNPFGSDDEEADVKPRTPQRTPVPTPRRIQSMTPEPTPRFNLSNNNSPGHSFKGSTSSLSSSTDCMSLRRKKKKAPAPPPLLAAVHIPIVNAEESIQKTPKKKRPAPTPPTSTPISSKQSSDSIESETTVPSLYLTAIDSQSELSQTSKNSLPIENTYNSTDLNLDLNSTSHRRLIPLEESLIEEGSSANTSQQETDEIQYRRKIVPLTTQTTEEGFENLEQMKDNKEAQNRQRQSQGSLSSAKSPTSESNESLPYLNKSSHGKWKRRKGPAPALPAMSMPQRRILQMLPLQEIRHELEVIEVQQQGLEKQGVMLEKMIRERCEGPDDNRTSEELLQALPTMKNSKEVEDLILQLFELVNEKNELFRRQAELMYLRRMHRLEEEQADVEYEIRKLMAQPEHNKTDSDKTKEEALIARLVEIVQLRNEVVDCLEMDRLREVEEDLSIKQRMESHTAKLDQEYLNQQQTPTKLSKKEKKKLKESKKLKNKKMDADKDLDTSETSEKTKKKKKKFLF